MAFVESNPDDDTNAIVEIRPGAGGEEPVLWAGDVHRMLSSYAWRRGFAVVWLPAAESEYSFAVEGAGAYAALRFERGTHRVQRVPETEHHGRIHTSTAVLAVKPDGVMPRGVEFRVEREKIRTYSYAGVSSKTIALTCTSTISTESSWANSMNSPPRCKTMRAPAPANAQERHRFSGLSERPVAHPCCQILAGRRRTQASANETDRQATSRPPAGRA